MKNWLINLSVILAILLSFLFGTLVTVIYFKSNSDMIVLENSEFSPKYISEKDYYINWGLVDKTAIKFCYPSDIEN